MRCGIPIRSLSVKGNLLDGDILLLGSSTIRGRVLKLLTGGSSWAHCGIVVAPDSIVHADPTHGVILQSIDEYLAENNVDCISILRPQSGKGNIAATFALSCSQCGIAFDNSFGYKNGGGIYCTELVLLSWEAASVKILPEVSPGDRIAPSRLLNGIGLVQVWNEPSE